MQYFILATLSQNKKVQQSLKVRVFLPQKICCLHHSHNSVLVHTDLCDFYDFSLPLLMCWTCLIHLKRWLLHRQDYILEPAVTYKQCCQYVHISEIFFNEVWSRMDFIYIIFLSPKSTYSTSKILIVSAEAQNTQEWIIFHVFISSLLKLPKMQTTLL